MAPWDSTRRPEHLLNVVARNMSALPDHPTHFLDWLRTRTEYADTPDAVLRETFVPRIYRLAAIAQAVVPGLVGRAGARSGYRRGGPRIAR